MSTVIRIENLYKEYRLGVIGHGTLYHDLQSWWARLRGKEDPNSLIGHKDDGSIGDHILALNDITLEVEDGEVLGIIGRNGAGKSTLLKILSRVTAPSSGIVKVKGQIASLLEVGTGFHAELTGRENIYLNGAINGMDRTEITRKLDEIVDFAGVEKFIDTPVKRYSSGMSVRLGFAVAAHLEPDILVVDEVLAVGDFAFQKKAIGKMKKVSGEEGRTVLFVSHNMNSIKKLCTRSILIKEGKIIQDGQTDDVVNKYLFGSNNDFELGEKVWTTKSQTNQPQWTVPGDELVRLKAVRLLSDSGEVTPKYSVRDNINVLIEYEIFKDFKYFDVALIIKNERGEVILNSYENTRERSKRSIAAGSYKSVCKIPGDFLNDGRHFLSFGITEWHVIHVHEEKALSFDVMDTMDTQGSRGEYRPGKKWALTATRPRFEWHTEATNGA